MKPLDFDIPGFLSAPGQAKTPAKTSTAIDRDASTLGNQLSTVADSGSGEAGSEVVSVYDGKLYVTNGAEDRIDIFDAVSGAFIDSIDLTTIEGYAGVQSVDVSADGIVVAIDVDNAEIASEPMLVGQDGWTTQPIFTVGGTLDNGYQPIGILDGIGAIELDANTVRVYVNHELGNAEGTPYEINGVELTGARISYFDIDKATMSITDGGLAYNAIYNPDGTLLDDVGDLVEGRNGLDRLCSGAVFQADEFGAGNGIVDTIYFAGEETGGVFSNVSGNEWALDIATGELWAVPAMGRGSWENITQIDTGTTTHVAFILADDTAPFDADGDGADEAAPLFLYVGEKDASGDFLERNGLKDGKLYVWVADSGDTVPSEFNGNGESRTGTWVEIDNTPDLSQASEDGSTGYDEYGYPTQKTLWTRAEAAGAFGFSRPEDVSTNPADGSEIVLASTGVSSYDGGADTVGTLYTVQTSFDASGNPISGTTTIIYDGDADPSQTLRSPDNLDWADDGKIYVQEDRAVDGIFGDGAVNPADAGVVVVDPLTGNATRIAEIDQTAISPLGAIDENVGADGTGSIDIGDWESSGILDVSSLFGYPAGSLFLVDVQAHSLDDQDRFSSTEGTIAGLLTDGQLKEGGQLLFLAAPGVEIEVQDPIDPEYAQNGLVARFDLDGNLIDTVEVGNLPDMVTYSNDGTMIFVANEGEAQDVLDPKGSISIIDVVTGDAETFYFDEFDAQVDALRDAGVRIFPDRLPSTDFEPEYIAEGADGKLYVTLQEANAVAVFDLDSKSWERIIPLGTSDHSAEGFGIDPSDRDDAIAIQNVPVAGLRMPDAIATVEIDGEVYFLTANEGDSRDFDEARGEDLVDGDLSNGEFDAAEFPEIALMLEDETLLGRLNFSNIDGDTDGDGLIEELHSFGSRSFTIFDEDGNVVFDSGDDFESVIAANRVPNAFNNDGFPSDEPGVIDENRSDNKGPEPEAIAVGKVGDATFAFIGLERDGGIMIYDISDPSNPAFVDYIDSSADGNIAPEVIRFIPADESPSGLAQIAVSYEISGTTAVYDLELGKAIIGTNKGDELSGGLGDDDIAGGNGRDLILGGAGDDEIDGGNGKDKLAGGTGNDLIHGGNGADWIHGGQGDDELDGGRGPDTFFFDLGDGQDTIVALQRNDKIDLSSTGLSFGELVISDLGGGAFEVAYGASDTIHVTLAMGNATLDEADFVL